MRKRFLSLLLAVVMILNLTMPTVWAAGEEELPAVTNGYYNENGQWQQGGDGKLSYQVSDLLTLNLSKTAKKVSDNVFDITLQVESITKTVMQTNAAAVVLTIDLSNSMKYCAECGDSGSHDRECALYNRWDNNITETQTRLYAAKQAALQFLAGTPASEGQAEVVGYAGKDADATRMLAIVGYGSTAKTFLSWTNVAGGAGKNGYDNAVNVINSMQPGFTTGWNDTDTGGTNLDSGIRLSKNLLGMNTLSAGASKFAVVLTDGKPTFRMTEVQNSTTAVGGDYHSGGLFSDDYFDNVGGGGSAGSNENNTNAKNSADALKALDAKLYTVCFGVANENTYSGGPTVGNFLKNSVATAEYTDEDGVKHTYAYNADNTAGLMAAFSAITEDITEGIKDIVVNDPMGDNVAVTTPAVDLPTGVVGDASNLTWTLQDEDGTQNPDGTTSYVYTMTYRIKLDADAEGFDESIYHPANKVTILTMDGEEYQFPVPGVRGVTSRYTVIYDNGDYGTLAGEDKNGQVVHGEIKKHSTTPVAPLVTPDADHYFIGWSPVVSPKVTDNVTYVAQYAEKGEITITGNSGAFVYNGSAQSVSGYTTAGLPEGFTVADVSAQVSGTDVGEYVNVVSGTAKILDNTGKDVSEQFKVNYVNGKMEITPLAVNVTITGAKESVVYDGSEHAAEGYDVSISNSLYTVNDFSFSGSAVVKGTAVDTYPMGLAADQFANENDNFTVTFTVADGELKISPKGSVVVTIVGNKDTVDYNGAEQKVEGYEVSISDPLYTVNDFVFTGEAVAKGTDVGTYAMGLKAEQFANKNANFENVVFNVTDGELKIEPLKVTVTITGNSDTKVYNGAAQKVEGYAVSISDALYTEADFSFNGSAVVEKTNVGTYPMGLAAGQFVNNNKNFDVTFVVTDGGLKITPVEGVVVTVTGNTASVIFNGAEQQVKGYDVSINHPLYTEADFSFNGNDVASGINVGKYPMGLREGDFVNNNPNFADVTFVVEDGQLEITKKAVTVTITGNRDTKPYSGAQQQVTGYVVSISDALYQESDFVFAGEAVAKGANVGTYPMGLAANKFQNKNDNFDVTFVVNDGQLEITPVDTVVVTIVGNSDSKTYNGNEQSVSDYTVSISNPLYKESDFSFSGSAVAKGTNVGTYAMGLSAEQFVNNNANFKVVEFQVTDGSLTINPAEVTVVITGNTDEKVYNGAEQKVEGYTVGINNSLYQESDFNFSGSAVASGTNVGTYPMGLAVGQFQNKNDNFVVTFEVTDGQLEITPLEGVIVTITGNTDSKVFNGSQQQVNGYQVSINNELYAEENIAFSGSAVAAGTNVGKYPMGLAAGQFQNVNPNFADVEFKVIDGELEITKKAVTVTIVGNKNTLVYNGAEQKVEGYTVTIGDALYKEEYFVFNGEAVAKGTNVGIYAMGLKAEQFVNENGNFDVTFVVTDGQLEITKKAVTVTVVGNKDTLVYNGAEQKVEGYTVTIGDELYKEEYFAFNGQAVAAGTDVGTYAMGLKAEQFVNENGNFDVTFVVTDGQLEITKKAVNVVIVGSKDILVYNGAEQKVEGYTVTIADELYKEEYFVFNGEAVAKGALVGTYAMGLKAEQFVNENGNFDVTFEVTDGQLEIIKKAVTVTITGNKDTLVYNGAEQKVEGYTFSADDALYTAEDFTFDGEAVASGIFVGKYDMGLKAEQFANNNGNFDVTFVVIDGELEITPVKTEIVITAASDSKIYDGTALQNAGYTYDIALLVNGDYIVAVVEGEQTNFGSSANVVVSYRVLRGAATFRGVEDVTDCYAGISTVDGVLEITKRSVTLTSGSDSKKYDGTELKKEEVTVSGNGFVEGEGAVYSEFAGITEVGSVDNTFTYTLNENTLAENYDITVVPGVLTVNKNTDAKLEGTGYTGVYDGAEHDGVTDKQVTGGVEGDVWEYSYSVDGETYSAEMPMFQHVGTYTVYVKAENPNYEGDQLITTVTVTITPATITVTADDKTIATGDAEPELTYQVSTTVESEEPLFQGALTREPGNTKGEYEIQQGDLALAEGDEFLPSDYELVFVPGTLTILQRSIKVDKTVNRDMVFVGEDIIYTIVVTNDGEVDLADVILVDEMLSVNESIGALAVGESKTITLTYTATDADWEKTLYNTVVVTSDGGVTDEDTSEGTTVYVPIPDTGDHTPVELLMGMMLAALVGMVALVWKRKELAE